MSTAQRAADITPGRMMKGSLVADLIKRNDEEELPELFSGGHVVATPAGSAKKTAEDRLHNILGIQTRGQVPRAIRPGQGMQALGVAHIELQGGILVAALEAPHQ
jgi:hypothetical protein